MGKFNEAEILAVLVRDAKEPLTIQMERYGWLAMLSAIQLACRHPHFVGPTRNLAEQAARQIASKLADENEVLREFFEAGWNPDFDIPTEPK